MIKSLFISSLLLFTSVNIMYSQDNLREAFPFPDEIKTNFNSAFSTNISTPYLNKKHTKFFKDTLSWNYNNIEFNNGAKFEDIYFPEGVSFKNLKSKSPIHFDNVTFEKGFLIDSPLIVGLKFNYTKFSRFFLGSLEMKKTFITEPLVFKNCYFKKKVNLSSIFFLQGADFSHSTFEEELKFVSCTSNRVILFDYVYFKKGMKYDVSSPPGGLSFFNCKSDGEIDLTNTLKSNFKSVEGEKVKCKIDLLGAPIEQMNFRYANFEIYRDIRYFEDYEKSSSNLYTREDIFDMYSTIYERLLANFKKRGYYLSYIELDKEYREFQYLHHPTSKTAFINFLQKYWWGYGYEKHRIIKYTIFLYLFFFIVNWIYFSKLRKDVYSIERINKAIRTQTSWKLIFSHIFLVFAYTAFVFFGLKLNIENIKFEKKRLTTYIFFQFLVGILCLAFLINFVLTDPTDFI